jgi:hypothetical protein
LTNEKQLFALSEEMRAAKQIQSSILIVSLTTATVSKRYSQLLSLWKSGKFWFADRGYTGGRQASRGHEYSVP